MHRKRKRSGNIPRPGTNRCSSVGWPHFSQTGGLVSGDTSALSPCSSVLRRARSSTRAFSPASLAPASVLNSGPDSMIPRGVGRLRISQVHTGGRPSATVTTKYSSDRRLAGIVLKLKAPDREVECPPEPSGRRGLGGLQSETANERLSHRRGFRLSKEMAQRPKLRRRIAQNAAYSVGLSRGFRCESETDPIGLVDGETQV